MPEIMDSGNFGNLPESSWEKSQRLGVPIHTFAIHHFILTYLFNQLLNFTISLDFGCPKKIRFNFV